VTPPEKHENDYGRRPESDLSVLAIMKSAHLIGALAVSLVGIAACSSSSPESRERTGTSSEAVQAFPKAEINLALAAGDWSDALAASEAFLSTSPTSCDALYASLIATTMLVVDSIDTFVLPTQRTGIPPQSPQPGQLYAALLEQALELAQETAALSCEYTAPAVPLLIGDSTDPIVKGEIRGTWTTRTALLLGAIHSALLYDFQVLVAPQPVQPPPAGQTNPPLPQLLALMKDFLLLHQAALFTQPTLPFELRGGWFDRNFDGLPDGPDELLVDIFVPGTDRRVFDFSSAEFVAGQALPQLPLTPTPELPPAQCGYQRFHISDVATGPTVSGADGITLSPDGTKAVIPLLVSVARTQLYSVNTDGTNPSCLTCGQPGNNDGARWRPGRGDAILFVSTRDHANAIGGDGAGIGQELYVMRPDGSEPTRLTFSNLWATNYHANWSPDGKRVVWGRTEDRTWDVIVADFISDEFGMRLGFPRRIVHDTSWWETHGFSADGTSVITTNTRAGFLSTDLYSVDLFTGLRKRLTSNMTWDEHAHLAPDGRKLAWISSRYRPASVAALNDGSLSPVYDFLWIVPGIFFEFANPPAGYTTELTLADADGTDVQQLTNDNQVVADNEWSTDSRQVIYRQTDPTTGTTRIRLLTFDDCE
jgi:Tol biopolymer transport system component